VNAEQVVVVGAGPVGLVTALGLARRGIAVTVIEREADVFRSPRAMGYHWGALYILEDLGLVDDLLVAGFPARGIRLRVRETGEDLDLTTESLEARVRFPHSLTLGQDRVAEIAIEHLTKHENVDVRWRTEVTGFDDCGDHVEVHTVGPDGPVDLRASWLVAADGASSNIRRQLGIAFEGMTWPTAFVATNVQGDLGSLGYKLNNYLIDPDYGAVIAQITKDDLWRVAFSVDAEMPEAQVDTAVDAYLCEIFPVGFEYEVRARTKYRMHQRAATSMREGRVVLVGDSAHATNPTSGYGLVGGLHDANILTEALAAVIWDEVSDDVLDQYSKDRIAAFLDVSSPASVASKELVFDLADPDAVETRMATLRALAADPDAMFEFWQAGCYIETPSLLTNERLSAGRNGQLRSVNHAKQPVDAD
jgi:3-(3-hydroxy-phenyl)propionate hydroxylase